MAAKKRRMYSSIQPPPERYRKFMDGEISVEDLDDEEIQRMQLRNESGTFAGRAPVSLPREFIMAIRIEQQRRFQHWINVVVPQAQATIVELMNSKKLMPGDATRLKAAQEIIERFAGKTPDRVEVKAEVSVFDSAVADILVDIDDEEVAEIEE